MGDGQTLEAAGPARDGTETDLYEDDFYVWTQRQAAALRRLDGDKRVRELDVARLAEEVEDLGKEQRNAVRSQLRRIIEHCLKLEYSPAEAPRPGWNGTISDARAELEDRLTPSLRRDAEEQLPRLFAQARSKVRRELEAYGEHEAAARLPASLPFGLDQLLTEDWFPAAAGRSDPRTGQG